ncbi:hypothetical protein D3C83_144330 [compost metagenome]
MSNYFFGLSTGLIGVVVVLFGATVSDSFTILELESLMLPEKLKLDNKIKTIKIVANVQVLLSRKSVVF